MISVREAPSGPPEFTLPPELEAHEPPEARGLGRDEVRLLVTYRATGRISHRRFVDLPDVLRPGDLIVVNDSATLPAALAARRGDGTAVALHLSAGLTASLWIVEPRQTRVGAGEVLTLPAGGVARMLVLYPGSQRLWISQLQLPEVPLDYLMRVGRPITYPYVRGEWPLAMYQTVYAREPGSAEMPSAGRAFTPEVLARAAARGIGLARITLHTSVASLERDEPPIEEWYRVPPETVAAIESARETGGRVIAVGTTVVRALESAADARGRVMPSQGWTDLIITPSRRIRAMDGLLTGFHEPRASHLAMLTAFAGRVHLEHAYRAALEARYLWHEFGDLHLIL
ncbi:MAG TPA: S-adenosylmethionine:tRNA ribosyltransferase-isomerase [bacterium]|nr:S-adenosylmethionine:tRNA ribosyltransferase-isomerase [bacterium]